MNKLINTSSSDTENDCAKFNLLEMDNDAPLTNKQIEYFKEQLIAKKKQLIHFLEFGINIKKHCKSSDFTEPNSTELDINLSSFQAEKCCAELTEIENALERIEDGTYGFCIVSGERISNKRLMLNPAASMCVQEQEKFDKMEANRLDEDDNLDYI